MFHLFVAIAVALACLPLSAQSTFGSLTGTITDASQAPMAGAHLQLRHLEENASREAESGADGQYQFLNLKPGHYALTVTKDGFTEAHAESVGLEARQAVRLDFTMQVEAIGQSVEVDATAAPIINTESGVLSDTKNFRQVTGLPVNYRGATTSPLAALATVPGVQQDNNGNVSIGGGLPSQVQYSLDGVSTVNVRMNGALQNMNPSSELISEFKVTQFNNSAEFSQAGDVTITTKSGSNQWHGSGFEYFQNSGLDATVYGFDAKAHKVFNTFGGSFSGPVEIPKLYSGKDKTFFFVDYEGNRRRFATPQQSSVPTAAMRSGDMTGLPGNAVVDPSTGLPFPDNRIPASRLNPVAQSLFANYLPLPNYGNGSDTNANFRRLVPTPSDTNGYDVRLDHNFNSKHQVYGRWTWKNLNGTTPNALLPAEGTRETDRNLILSHNWTLSNSLINEARFGFSNFRYQVLFPISGASAVSTLGLQGLDLSDVPNVNAFPTFNFSDGTGFSSIGRDKTGVTQSRTLQFADNLLWMKGRHTIKTGVDVRRVQYRDLESFGGSNDFGAFTFSSANFTGNAFGDMLLGLPATTYVAQSGPDVVSRAYQTGLYVQDEFRVNSRLTLSVGLRWQALPPFVSDLGNLTAFNPATGGVILPDNGVPRQGFLIAMNACPGVNPNLPCGPVQKASDVGLGNGLRQFYKGNFQPRASFAYRPFGNNKTVIRGGLGIFTMTNLGQLSFNTTNILVSVVRTNTNGLVNGQPAYAWPNVGAPATPQSLAGTQDFYQNVALNYRDPQSVQWNFTVERELAADFALRVSYAGMNSYRMSQTVDLNQVRSSTMPYQADERPYRNWGRLLSSENLGFANYQSLQTEINKKFSHGLMFQASHTWAKNLGNVSGDAPGAFTPEVIYGTAVADRFNLGLNRGDVSGTRRQRVLISGMYQLPFGRGRAWMNHSKTWMDGLLGGWELSTVTLVETGPFLTPTISPNLEQANLNLVGRQTLLRPDRIGDGNVSNPTPDHYFDLSAFTPTPAGSGRVGNAGVGILRGPGTVSVAGGLSKTVAIRERLRMRVEATFTNLGNHPNFAAPFVDVTTPATFGKTTSVQSAENSGNRTGQLAVRFDF